jgi:hypothetical protein
MQVYWQGTGRSSNCLNRYVQEVLGSAPAINLMIFFWKWKSSDCWKSYSQNYSVCYNEMKICTINWSECVNVIDMEHQLNGITYSTELRNQTKFPMKLSYNLIFQSCKQINLKTRSFKSTLNNTSEAWISIYLDILYLNTSTELLIQQIFPNQS